MYMTSPFLDFSHEAVIFVFLYILNALLSLKDGSYTPKCSGPWMAEAGDWCCWTFSMCRPGNESKFEVVTYSCYFLQLHLLICLVLSKSAFGLTFTEYSHYAEYCGIVFILFLL